jgi:outer membrane protein OmpA-like peptidoglycan-associated protein
MRSGARALAVAVAVVLTVVFTASYASAAGVSYNGTRGLLRTKAADTVGKGNLAFALSSHFQKLNDVEVGSLAGIFDDPGNPATVDYLFFITRVGLTYGLNDYFEIAASLDVRNWVRTVGDDGGHELDTFTRGGVGDTEVTAKLSIPLPTDRLKVGAAGTFSFPTGNEDRGFTTNETDITILGLATVDLTHLERFVPTRLHFNGGYRINRNEDDGYGIFNPEDPDASGFNPPGYPLVPPGEKNSYNDALLINGAVEFPAPQVTFFVEFNWERLMNIDIDAINEFNVANGMDEVSQNTLTLSPGIEFTTAEGSALKIGGDLNLNSGDKESVINAPDWGLWLAIGYTAEIIPSDADRDGVRDEDDPCPNDPEDLDGFEDSDGCPDLDNDGDGIADDVDGCPDLAEDFDGFQDEDGCPDKDNDQDGIVDSADRCPNEPEDFDGDNDGDGCPDLVKDSDSDGVADDVDRCPLQTEDIDGFQDDDGCPDLDNDLDGIPDEVDNCPNSPETFNGYQDEDGCPDEKPIEEKFILKGVNFESGSSALTPDSYTVLDDVVRSLQAYPEVKVEIRGHTDSQGPAGFNLELSHKRADSVKQYLVNSGIDPSRVATVGVGEEEPVSSNSTPEGRAQNRRIEFRRLN